MDESTAAQGGRDPHAASFTPLEALIARTRPCCLRPFRFFVSWQGVLTLAYTYVLPPRPRRSFGMHNEMQCALAVLLLHLPGMYRTLLVHRGFPPALMQLKHDIGRHRRPRLEG